MIDWLTWFFGYVYAKAKKQDGATTTVWQAIADDAASYLYDACGSNKQLALDTFDRWKFDDTENGTLNTYIEDWINAQ